MDRRAFAELLDFTFLPVKGALPSLEILFPSFHARP
jgi:hypothetical protein